MSRNLSGAMLSEIGQPQLAPVFFIELDFLGGFARVWNGIGTISWDGKQWLGGGELIGIGQIEETRDIEATSLSMSLSGVPPAMVSAAYGDFSQGRAAKIWLGAMDNGLGQIITDPVAIFQGRMDTIADSDDGVEAVITVTAESNLADLKRLRARFLTDQEQQRLFPGDRSLRFLPSLQDRPIYWNTRQTSPPLPTA